MAYLVYVAIALVMVLPALLLLFAAFRLKTQKLAKRLFVCGSLLVLLVFFADAGTIIVSSLGDAQRLARYAMIQSVVSGSSKFFGITLIAAGMLLHNRTREV